MDPVSAIGIAAAVVQFVQLSLTVVSRLEEIQVAHPGEVPRSLTSIKLQLPLLTRSLDRIAKGTEIQDLDIDTKCIIRGVVNGCHSQVAEIESMIEEAVRIPGESLASKLKKVFKSFKNDEKLLSIERNLQTYIAVLVLHRVVDASEAPPVLSDDAFFDMREQLDENYNERPELISKINDLLHDASRSRVKTPTRVSLVGSRGVGKTQLALAYCFFAQSQRQFRTVFWLDASSLENIYLGVESIYASVQRSISGSRAEKVKFVQSFLSNLWHPWLLVVDNYTGEDKEIEALLPTHGSGGIIITTRREKKSPLHNVLYVPKFLTWEDQLAINGRLAGAVETKKTKEAIYLLDQGADVHSLISDKWPVLTRAAIYKLYDVVEALLTRGADPHLPSRVDKPLQFAAGDGYTSICRLLLDYEDETDRVSSPVEIQSAFAEAASNGHLEVMRLLLSRRKPDISQRNEWDETLLQYAARKGHKDILLFLIEQGVLEAKGSTEGSQAMIAAASKGNHEIVKILCSQPGVNVNFCDEKGFTALYHASTQTLEMVEYLLSEGADLNVGSGSPLQRAAIGSTDKMVRLLLKHGLDPTKKDKAGFSPLAVAISNNRTEIITTLIEVEVHDATTRLEYLNHNIRHACKRAARDAVFELLEAGADINVNEVGQFEGGTPLLLAVTKGDLKTTRLLIRRGAKQDIADDNGRLPLTVTVESGNDDLVLELLQGGGDPNMRCGPNKDTLLMIAAGKKRDKVVKVLLECGAKKKLANKFGDTALDIAKETKDKKTIELLK